MQYINNFSQKIDKVSIDIISSDFSFQSWVHHKNLSRPLFFLIYINNLSNHTVSTAKRLAANDILFFIAHNAKMLADELNSDLKANVNAYP